MRKEAVTVRLLLSIESDQTYTNNWIQPAYGILLKNKKNCAFLSLELEFNSPEQIEKTHTQRPRTPRRITTTILVSAWTLFDLSYINNWCDRYVITVWKPKRDRRIFTRRNRRREKKKYTVEFERKQNWTNITKVLSSQVKLPYLKKIIPV